MANASNSTTLRSSGNHAYTLQAYFNEEGTNTPNNSSRLYVEAKLTSTGYKWTSQYNSYLRIYWHDNRENYDRLVGEVAATSIAYNGSIIASGYIDPLFHNDDGNLSGYAYATWTKGGTSTFTPNSGSVTTSWTGLTSISRQANVTGYWDFNDEQNPTITYNNPGGFRINARLEFGGTIIRRDNISNTGSYTFSLTDGERKLLRQKCTGNSMTVRGVIATCIGGTTENYWSYWDRTMTIVNGNPTFSNFTFTDINSKTIALTGNNQNVIKGYSNIKVTIPTVDKAVAKKEATMNKYRFTCGDKNSPDAMLYSETDVVVGTINGTPNGTLNVYAIDSRNNSTLVTKLANQVIDYIPLTKGEIEIGRNNGVSEQVTLKFEGQINIINFGVKTNSIKSTKFRYKSTESDSEWSEFQDIEVNVNDSTFSFEGQVKGDTEGLGFNVANSYQVEVIVEDELSEVTYTDKFGSGTPNLALAKNGVGIMGKYDEEIGGKAQVAGNPMAYYPIGSIYASLDSKSPAELFGGSWERLENLFLWASNISETLGKTGGEKTHTLTINEIPSHRHNLAFDQSTNGGTQWVKTGGNSGGPYYSDIYVQPAGGGQAHNNMPPHINCAIWKRTA